MLKKNPSGSAYKTVVEGTFSCTECDEVVKKASWDERTGELEWKCTQDHVSKARM
jgi:hypothetical protein